MCLGAGVLYSLRDCHDGHVGISHLIDHIGFQSVNRPTGTVLATVFIGIRHFHPDFNGRAVAVQDGRVGFGVNADATAGDVARVPQCLSYTRLLGA